MAEKKLMVVIGAKATEFNKVMAAVQKDTRSISKAFKDVGKDLAYIGGGMTKAITAPVVAAATAAAGLVATLGWKRLVAIDSAKAQLEGFGYSLKDVERISEQVNRAVTGTVMTMAEGTSVAAGALAAGVKEGAELEAYIKRVGNAAVGANRPVEEMAMIFNRVQGGGRLMTRELNMIEQGMPGFSMTMAEHLGVPLAEFRKMVTGGKVSAAEFMAVMDDFAGDMADAYANTWEGMVANTKANIGIIGQSLLSGVFEQSKESIGEFLELLRSDEAKEWAKETGAKIAETFGEIVETVKNLIEWWGGLSDGTKKAITTIAGILVIAGPILLIAGKIFTAIGVLIPIISKIVAVVKILGSIIIGGVSVPILIVVAAIAAAIAIGVLLYKNWDKIKEMAIKVWGAIKDFFVNLWEGIKGAFSSAWEWIKKVFVDHHPAVLIYRHWDEIKEFFADLWDRVKEIFSNAIDSVVTFFTELPGRIGKFFLEDLPYMIGFAIGTVIRFFMELPGKIWEFLQAAWEKMGEWASSAWEWAKETGANIINSIVQFFSELPGKVWTFLTETYEKLTTWASDTWEKAKETGRNVVEGFINFTKELPGKLWNWLLETIRKVITWTGDLRKNAIEAGSKLFNSFIDEIKGLPSKLWNVLLDAANTLLNIGGQLWNNAKRVASNLWEGFKKGLGIASPSFIERAMDDIADRAKDLPGELQKEFSKLKMLDLAIGDIAISGERKGPHMLPFNPVQNTRDTHDTREVRLLIDLKNIPAHMDQGTLTEALRQVIRGGGIDRDLDEAGARSRRMVLAPQGGY